MFEYVASRISSNIRELEGALVRIGAWASLYQERIDLNLAQMMLKDFVSNPDDNEITVSLIMSQCAVYFGVTIEQMGSSERSHNVVEARQIAMYLCRELTDLSLPKIGQAFGRDHTTVMHANKKISKLMKEKRETFNHVSSLQIASSRRPGSRETRAGADESRRPRTVHRICGQRVDERTNPVEKMRPSVNDENL